MNRALFCLGLAAWVLSGSGCASRRLPDFEPPLRRAAVQHVRTTAYTHTESDHRKYGVLSAWGTPLQLGAVRSAAADWARWPAGTRFRVVETGQEYEVDDYGWALSGTNTIDLYTPTRREMNEWGVRRVTIEILAWGDADRSLRMLLPRSKHPHVRRMIKELKKSGLKTPSSAHGAGRVPSW